MSDAELSESDDVLPRETVISLREVTQDNLREVLRLKVRADQEHLVANNAVSIAQAHFEGDSAWFRAIYADETPAGFVMIEDDRELHEAALWRFMIDQRYQRLGIGWKALELVVAHVRTLPGVTVFETSYVPGVNSPAEFYHKFGFVDTGEMDEDEVVTRLAL